MTFDEFKSELEAFVARIDESLAEEIRTATDDGTDPWPGSAWSCDALLPRDKSSRPSTGYNLHVSLSAWFSPVRYHYDRGDDA